MAETGMGARGSDRAEGGRLRVFFTDFCAGIRRYWSACAIICAAFALLFVLACALTRAPAWRCAMTMAAQLEQGGESDEDGMRATLSGVLPGLTRESAFTEAVAREMGVRDVSGKLRVTSDESAGLFLLEAYAGSAEAAMNLANSALMCMGELARAIAGPCEMDVLGGPSVYAVPVDALRGLGGAVLGALIGLLIALVPALAYAMVRETVRTRGDLTERLGQVCLSEIPEADLPDGRGRVHFLNRNTGAAFRESVRKARVSLLRNMEAGERVILVTSAARFEGKTVFSANLASSLGMTGKRVLLVDANLRRPRVLRALRMRAGNLPGLREILEGKAAPAGAIRYSEMYHCSVVASDTRCDGAAAAMALLKPEKLREVIDSLRRRFDYVILDAPACGIMVDAAVLAQVADRVVLVVKQDTIRASDLAGAIDDLSAFGKPVTGCVLNRVSRGYGEYGSSVYGETEEA